MIILIVPDGRAVGQGLYNVAGGIPCRAGHRPTLSGHRPDLRMMETREDRMA